LALAWFHGDAVHADLARLAKAESFGITVRYVAAAGLVARIAVITLKTMGFLYHSATLAGSTSIKRSSVSWS
jgi:hypothetical protein